MARTKQTRRKNGNPRNNPKHSAEYWQKVKARKEELKAKAKDKIALKEARGIDFTENIYGSKYAPIDASSLKNLGWKGLDKLQVDMGGNDEDSSSEEEGENCEILWDGAMTSGTNCIKIGLPGKVILSKRKGLLEVLFS